MKQRIMNQSRRALMYVPGSSLKMLDKSLSMKIDSIVWDFEDGVSISSKQDARDNIHKLLNELNPINHKLSEILVRINHINSGFEDDDLKACLTAKYTPRGLIVPKVENSNDLLYVSKYIKKPMSIIAMVESASSLLNLKDILSNFKEKNTNENAILTSLIFGGDDYAASIGIDRTLDNKEIDYARNMCLHVAKAFNLQAIDIVTKEFKDFDKLKYDILQGKKIGYDGKQVIHPNQIDLSKKLFSPTKEKIIWAEKVIKAYKKNKKLGIGAFEVENEMIDLPTIKIAQKILNI